MTRATSNRVADAEANKEAGATYLSYCKFCDKHKKLGFHYGTYSCRSCSFYFYNLDKLVKAKGYNYFKCLCKKGRNGWCKACKYDKFVELGMKRDGAIGHEVSPMTLSSSFLPAYYDQAPTGDEYDGEEEERMEQYKDDDDDDEYQEVEEHNEQDEYDEERNCVHESRWPPLVDDGDSTALMLNLMTSPEKKMIIKSFAVTEEEAQENEEEEEFDARGQYDEDCEARVNMGGSEEEEEEENSSSPFNSSSGGPCASDSSNSLMQTIDFILDKNQAKMLIDKLKKKLKEVKDETDIKLSFVF